MTRNKLFLLLLYFSIAISFAQNSGEVSKKKLMSSILVAIEKEHAVKISYNPQLIEEMYCNDVLKEKTLDEKLENLSKQTHLSFSKINARYIVIQEREITKNHTICGHVLHSETKEPIVFAAVFIEGTAKGTTTNNQGFFELKKIASNQLLQVRVLGYYDLKIPVYQMFSKKCNAVYLFEENSVLEEVLIQEYMTQGISKKQDGGIHIVPTKLGILPGLIEPDVLLSLQLLPGIQSSSETASGLEIRGSSPDQNLVLFDGIKMYQSGHFFGLISSFNPYVTEEITIYKSGTQAKYGDRIGGVLDISSGEEVPEFETGFGVNLTHADAYIKTPLFHNKVGLIFSARRSITDLVATITYKNFSESVFQNTRILDGFISDSNKLRNVNNDFYFKDYNLKIVVDMSSKDKLLFSNLFNKNQLKYASENPRFRENVTDYIAFNNSGTRINWKREISEKTNQNIDLYISEYQFDYIGTRIKERNNPTNTTTDEFTVTNHVKDVGFKYDIAYDFSETSKISSGFQWSKTTVSYFFQNNKTSRDNIALSAENTQNKTQALFSEFTYDKNKTRFSLGVRANYFSSTSKWFFEPRLYFSAKGTNDFTFKFSGELKNQAVSQIIEYRNSGIGLENNIWAIANDRIPVLKSQQLSVGFLFQKAGWNLDVDVYHKKINGLTLMTDAIATRAPFYVSGKSTIMGLDLLLKKRFGNYRSWVSYTLSNTMYAYDTLNNGKDFNGIFDVPHAFTWSHTYQKKGIEFSLGWTIRSGIPYTKATGTFQDMNNNLSISYGGVNDERLPVYQKFDFSSTYTFAFSKNHKTQGKIGVSLTNLFNKRNILYRTYALKIVNTDQDIEEQTLVETDKISLGFTPNVVFRITF